MNVQSIDLGDELRQGLQLRLDLAPVVLCRPIARESLSRRELHSLRLIGDRLPLRPPCRVDALAQLGKFRFRNIIYMKRTNAGLTGLLFCNFNHGSSPFRAAEKTWRGPPERGLPKRIGRNPGQGVRRSISVTRYVPR